MSARRAAALAGTRALVCLIAGALAMTLAAALVRAQPDARDPAQRFDQATRAMAAGEHGRAAEMFEALARDAPDSALAGDALFTAAKLYEERLIAPARALALYRRLYQRYPDSRTALAARRRAEAIIELLGTGDQQGDRGSAVTGTTGTGGDMDQDALAALTWFTDIMQNFPERGEAESLALARALVAEHPRWSGVPRLLVWMANVHQRAGRLETALALYEQAAGAAAERDDQDEQLFLAYRGAGDVALVLGKYDLAERYFRMLPTSGDPGRERSRADSFVALDRARDRAQLYRYSLMAFGLALMVLMGSLLQAAGTWRLAWRAVRRPPIEVIFMAPIAAVLIASSWTAHYAIGPAVTIICAGGLIIAWLSGAGLLAGASRARVLVHAVVVIIAAVALCYLAVHHNRLIDMILETVRFGPDV